MDALADLGAGLVAQARNKNVEVRRDRGTSSDTVCTDLFSLGHVILTIVSRKKLEPESDKSVSSRVEPMQQQDTRVVEAPQSDANSVLQMEVPPWNEAYEISSTDIDGMSSSCSKSQNFC